MRLFGKLMPFIIIAILGILVVISGIKDKVELSKPPAKIEEMTETDFYNGRFVEGDIYEIWDEYATLEQSDSVMGIKYNTKTTAHYFTMPLESSFNGSSPKILSVAVRDASDITTAQKMERESLEYYGNDDADESVFVTKMHIKGKITKLKKDAAEIFDKCVVKEGYSPSTDTIYYVVNVGNAGNGTTGMLIIGIIATLVGLLGGFIVIMRSRRRGF